MLEITATDEEILAFIDEWVLLLEAEDYEAAFNFTKQVKSQCWTPELIKEGIKSNGDGETSQTVTLTNNGLAIDGAGNIEKAVQRKDVTWFDEMRGDVWYDLNIDNYISDLTATFDLEKTDAEILVFLNDIHVM